MKKVSLKLTLNQRTISNLNSIELQKINGGDYLPPSQDCGQTWDNCDPLPSNDCGSRHNNNSAWGIC